MAVFELPQSLKNNTKTEPTKQNIEAEAQADLARAFPMMVCGEVQTMRLALNEARNLNNPQRAEHIYSRLLPIAMRLKNQGAVFGYPLVTDVASHLYNYIQNHKIFNKIEFESVYNDVLTLQNILWKRISGDGGEEGRRILAQLI